MTTYPKIFIHSILSSQMPLSIQYGLIQTELGKVIMGISDHQVAHLSFIGESVNEAICCLQKEWPTASLAHSQEQIDEWVRRYQSVDSSINQIELIRKGTPFQIDVWKELLTIPFGTTISYEALANQMGIPQSVRAVARGVARNTMAFLIPCHRVILKSGAIHQYRWEKWRKKKLLELEKDNQSFFLY